MRREQTEIAADPLIMVLDRDPSALRSCEKALTAAGHHNLRLSAGLEGATVAGALMRADLVIWDGSLLGELGLLLLRQSRAHMTDGGLTPVLAMMNGTNEDRHEAMDIIDDFLVKPIDSTELIWRVQHLLDLSAFRSASKNPPGEIPVEISNGTKILESAMADLDTLAEAKDSFLASVSHGLRTPLTAVLGFADELAHHSDGLDREAIRDAAELIAEQATELSAIIDDFLVAARSDIDTVEVLDGEVDVTREVSVILAGMSATDRARISLPHGRLLVKGDNFRVRQILRNLLTNALKHGGRNIAVELDSHAGHSTVTVVDDGPGVPPGLWNRVFEPYFCLVEDSGQPHPVGLGLTISRLLARLMGGEVELVARSDGTAFQLTLPAVKDPDSHTHSSSNGHLQQHRQSADVLYEGF